MNHSMLLFLLAPSIEWLRASCLHRTLSLPFLSFLARRLPGPSSAIGLNLPKEPATLGQNSDESLAALALYSATCYVIGPACLPPRCPLPLQSVLPPSRLSWVPPYILRLLSKHPCCVPVCLRPLATARPSPIYYFNPSIQPDHPF